MRELISGAIVMGYIVAGLHFLKFWKRSDDRLFGIFAGAFAILALQRVLLSVLADQSDAHIMLYLVRVLAFLLIIFAIIDKNRAASL